MSRKLIYIGGGILAVLLLIVLILPMLLDANQYRPRIEAMMSDALNRKVSIGNISLSILSGAHMALAPRIMELLKANGQTDVKVFIGGIVPDDDVPQLKAMGIAGVFGPGASTEDIIKEVREAVK
mgnify:CR=1 FL=1